MNKVTSAAQTGVLMPGPGALRANSIQANLIPLTPDQQELVNKAKKYALEQSIKSVMMKQTQISSQQQQQKSLQRHQALILMCRVYVGSISFELKEETIKAAFAPFGAIKSINMSWDAVTQKHKGFAFVEYELPEAAQLALEQMNGIQLGGRQIKVGRPSNMPQAAPIIQQIQEECKEKNRIYLSNVHPDFFEPELINLFDFFGKVRSCKLALTPNSEKPSHRGYGYVEFETEEAAVESLSMDKFNLGGQNLHVCRATTPAENVSNYGTLESETSAQQLTSMTTTISTTTNATGTVVVQTNSDDDIQSQLEAANREQQEERQSIKTSSENSSSSDTDNTKLISQNGFGSRSLVTGGEGEGEDNLSDSNISNILVLRNMVTAEDELDDTLQLDVYEECNKYGQISQVVIYVDKAKLKHDLQNDPMEEDVRGDGETEREKGDNDSSIDQIKIFVKYKDNIGSRRALEALDGRFFAGRKVSAQYYDKDLFRLSNYSK